MSDSNFRPIYYLGCKISFTHAILAAIDELDPGGGRVCDLFSGSAVVGRALASSREVTTVDIQEYARVISSAMLRPARLSSTEVGLCTDSISSSKILLEILHCIQPLIAHEKMCLNEANAGNPQWLIELLESAPLVGFDLEKNFNEGALLKEARTASIKNLTSAGLWRAADTTVTRYFGGLYFSFQQAAMLDAILSVAQNSVDAVRDTLVAAALSTASQLVNTVGKQFAQPIRPRNKDGTAKAGTCKIALRDRSIDTLKTYEGFLNDYRLLPFSIGQPESVKQNYLDAIRERGSSFSIVYADPPYTRDHYSRYYHVLETICERDNPSISQVTAHGITGPSRGLYREDRHQSPFCIRSAAPAAFFNLFTAAREKDLPMVLSYSPHETGDGTHPRVVSINLLEEIARSVYAQVNICTVRGINHNRLNRGDLKLKTRDDAEVLIKCHR